MEAAEAAEAASPAARGCTPSKNEEHGALDVLRATDTEEHDERMHLEGHGAARWGLALHTIATLKKKRSMH